MDELSLAEVAAEEAGRVYRVRSRRALKRLPRASRELARLCDGNRTVEQVCRAAKVSLTHGLAVVAQLCAAGTLLAEAELPASGFTAEEEAFFASELPSEEPIEEEPAPPRRWVGGIIERVRDRLEVGLLDTSPSLR